MTDILVLIVVAVILILVILYIYKSKRKGNKCIGCPYAERCGKNNSSGCCSGNHDI